MIQITTLFGSTEEPSLVEAAITYVRAKWPVIHLYEITEQGICACRRGDRCNSAGKHPRTRHGFKNGTTRPDRVRQWWETDPSANIGILTGQVSGLLVLDVDLRSGGFESLENLEREHGRFLSSMEALTDGGGVHKYFSLPRGVLMPSRQLDPDRYPGIDIKAEGAYVVAPPSTHVSGKTYRWRFPNAK